MHLKKIYFSQVCGIISFLLLPGCYGVFQTAETLSPGKSMLGGSWSSFSGLQLQYRRGFCDKIDAGVKVYGLLSDLSLSEPPRIKESVFADVKIQLSGEKETGITSAFSAGFGISKHIPPPLLGCYSERWDWEDYLAMRALSCQMNFIASKTVIGITPYAGIKIDAETYKMWVLDWQEMPGGIERTTGHIAKPYNCLLVFPYCGIVFFPKNNVSPIIEWEGFCNVGAGINIKF